MLISRDLKKPERMGVAPGGESKTKIVKDDNRNSRHNSLQGGRHIFHLSAGSLGWGLPCKKSRGAHCTFSWSKTYVVLVPLRAISLKRSTEGFFAVHSRVLTRKEILQEIMCCFKVDISLGVKKILSHAHKTGSSYLL